jgi:hypothetical protein
MRNRVTALLSILLFACVPTVAQESVERAILVAGPDGNVVAELRSGDDQSIRLSDQLGQSIALKPADPTEGFIEVIDASGQSVVLGKDIGEWSAKLEGEETKHLVKVIVFNVAKGIAVIVALLVVRSIIGAIGRGVAEEEEKEGQSRTMLLKRVGELEAELADLEVEMARSARGN